MKRALVIGIAVIALGAGAIVKAQAPRSAAVQMKAAQQKAEVEGDLKGAIEEYKKVVAAAGSNRALAAEALVRMADCYQKLGVAEAQNIYQRVVREFADQRVQVALARVRLSGTPTAANVKGDRAVWTGPSVDPTGRVSPDGRFITYVDWNDGRLMIHDVAANVERALTPPAVPRFSQNAEGSVISSDSKQVAYVWNDQNDTGFRIAALRGSGFLQPREVFLGNDDVRSLESFDWSPDGKWIAAGIRRKDQTGWIALIAVADGSSRSMKSLDLRIVPERIFFSPDSKYIAYDLPGASTSQQQRISSRDVPFQRDVFVLAIDGNREIPAVVHSANEKVMGWSPDGTRLLFASDRTGSHGLWALPFADGKPQGSPELLKSDIGSSFSLGLTTSGALYIHKRIRSRDIVIAPIDLEAGKLVGPPASFSQGFVEGARNPVWSPDGKYLAYSACENGGCLAIRSVATGQVQLAPAANYVFGPGAPSWSPDSRLLLATGRDERGRDGIFRVDVQTGEVTPVIVADGSRPIGAQWSPDGKKVYFTRGPEGSFERDLASGEERKIPFGGAVVLSLLSPNGQYLAVRRVEQSTETASLQIAPVAGGQPRELLRLTQLEGLVSAPFQWTPDSSAVIIVKDTGSSRELWLLPVAGGRPRKLDIDPNLWLEGALDARRDGGFSLSPDGRSIAFQAGRSASEVWALENFLPAASAKK